MGAMKMTRAHYEHIKETMERYVEVNKDAVLAYSAGVSQKRLAWDIFLASGLNSFQCKELYRYLDDTHVDTALRSIVRKIMGKIN